jgi:hypothetical protein
MSHIYTAFIPSVGLRTDSGLSYFCLKQMTAVVFRSKKALRFDIIDIYERLMAGRRLKNLGKNNKIMKIIGQFCLFVLARRLRNQTRRDTFQMCSLYFCMGKRKEWSSYWLTNDASLRASFLHLESE